MENIYKSGQYLTNNPTWHAEDSCWKARQISGMLDRNKLHPATMCEVGCGAGEILSQLHKNYNADIKLYGYEISPQAYDLCKGKASDNLSFKLGDILEDDEAKYDVILLIDIIEHLEDYFNFLRKIKQKSVYKILHVPLDITIHHTLKPTTLLNMRRQSGHIHYFTSHIVFEILRDTGYDIIDYCYTAGSLELPARKLRRKIAKIPRRIVSGLSPDFAARLFGGFSLLILAK